jgi:glycine cleavage system H protein
VRAMTSPSCLHFPDDLHYGVADAVWARLHDDGSATVGITSLGLLLSGEIYMCRVKPVTTVVQRGRSVAVVELAKAIVSVKSALGGTVIEVNSRVEATPKLVHLDPYGDGWLARLTPTDLAGDREHLVSGPAAQALLARNASAWAR